MRLVPWWARTAAAAAPVLMIGGWTLAAARQPGGFDPLSQTISALAAQGASDRWLMTSAFAGVGACHTITALGLYPAALPGRIVLAAGGVVTVGVAAFPLDRNGESVAHAVAAGVALVTLAAWPAVAARTAGGSPSAGVQPSAGVPWGLRRGVSRIAAAVLLGLLAWFGVGLGGPRAGLAERVAAGAQSLWPLVVVLTARRRAGQRTRRAG